MGREYRVRVQGRQRPNPDATLVAQAIVQIARELWKKADEAEQAAKAVTENPPIQEPEETTP